MSSKSERKKTEGKGEAVSPSASPAAPDLASSEPSPSRAVVPPAEPVAKDASALEGGKAVHGATKSLKGENLQSALRSQIEKKVSRPGVVRMPTFDSPTSASVPVPPTAPSAPGGWIPVGSPTAGTTASPAKPSAAMLQSPVVIPVPPGAPGTAGATPASVTPPPLPEWLQPAPDDPFPLTADDVPLDFYPIKEPYAYVLITYNNKEKEALYRVIEPRLTPDEQKILKFVEHTMVDLLDMDPSEIDRQTHEQYLAAKFEEILHDYALVLGEDEAQEAVSKGKLLYYLNRDFIGEGRIDVMTRDELIEDISCDGAHQPIFLYHRKHESIKSNVKFASDEELDSFVIRMAQRAGKHVSIAEPILDATMRDGSRLQATLSREVSSHGSTFTIRKFRSEPFTPPDLVRFGTMSAEILAYWWIAIQHGASAIYAGGTASGKTTSLNAILLFIPPQMKIVSIEDTRELSLPHPNWIAGITRSGFGARDREGHQVGEIDMFQLLKNALRQRPEYIIVGEVRGKEAYNLFQAMATGHAAYGTMHADSVDAVIHRLESDPINVPRSLLEALDIVSVQIQTRVGGKRVRRTKQLSEIVGLDPHTHEILTNEVFRWQPKDDSFKFSGVSYVLERIQVEKGMTPQQMKQEIDNRVELIKYMVRHSVRKYHDVARIVTSYYKDPVATMERVRKDETWT